MLDETLYQIASNVNAYEEIKEDIQRNGVFAYNSAQVSELAFDTPQLLSIPNKPMAADLYR